MKEVSITSVPVEVTAEDFEDLLVTSKVFIGFFNTFLTSSVFPEPITFNPVTATFEILSGDEKAVSRDIKTALRAHRRPKPLYRFTKDHSFSSIPLRTLDPTLTHPTPEIKTSITVKTLNREQGIHWVKKERLPQFLKSRWYHEYRLGQLVAQATVFTRTSKDQEPIMVKIDKPAEAVDQETGEVHQPADEKEELDSDEAIMYRMFVSLGDTTTTQSQQWFSQARAALTTQTTTTCARPVTAATRPISAVRPVSARTLEPPDTDVDSGVALTLRNLVAQKDITMSDVPKYAPSMLSMDGADSHTDRLFDFDSTRVPTMNSQISGGHQICAIAPPIPEQRRVYKPAMDRLKVDFCEMTMEELERISDLVVMGTLKSVLCRMTGFSEKDLLESETWKAYWESSTKNGPSDPGNVQLSVSREHVHMNPKVEDTIEVGEKTVAGKLVIGERNPADEVEKLLDSEDEYETDGRDDFFKKSGKRPLDLNSYKGMNAFQTFLQGTEGEKDWNMWIDIETAKHIRDNDELNNYINYMREIYHRNGATLELSPSRLQHLGLTEPTKWTCSKLLSIQSILAEQLITYWGPRFILSQIIKHDPSKKVLLDSPYLQFLSCPSLPITKEIFPNPPTATLLPHRPRTCQPRLHVPDVKRTPPVTDEVLQQLDSPFYRKNDEHPKTHPPLPNARQYDLPGWYKEFSKPNPPAGPVPMLKPKPPTVPITPKGKTPRQLVEATLRVEGQGLTPGRNRIESVTSDRLHSATDAPRPSSATSVQSTHSSTVSEDYLGGRRMEGLLKALTDEKVINGWMKDYFSQVKNKAWTSCLAFWRSTQEYHELFFTENLSPFDLKKKSKAIYMTHLGSSASQSVGASEAVRKQIYGKLNPPYEDLFDPAEEHVLTVLYDAWCKLLCKDLNNFSKIEMTEVRRQILDPQSKILAPLRRRGLVKERSESVESLAPAGSEDQTYNAEELLEKIPEEFRDWSLNRLIHSRLELEHFRKFLEDNYASTDLTCWMDIEAFRRIPHGDDKKRDSKSKDIKAKYFNKKYYFGPNSPASKEGQHKVIEASGGWGHLLSDQLKNEALLIAQKYVAERLEKKWLLMFLATKDFQERQKPDMSMSDAADDVMTIKRKKSQAIWKLLESKWVSASKDVMDFRKALSNPLTAHQFKRYMSIKGDNFENDVTFYLEVQKYKDLCHLHSERSLIQQKTHAIINCFIDSPIPPPIQVDIPPDVAERLLDRKMEASPYLFLEAQLTVFRVLLGHWGDFCTFRGKLTEEKLLPTIERQRKRARALEKKKQKMLEDKKAEVEARRIALGLPPGANLDDVYDPFAEQDDDEKGKTWKYSQYIAAMDGEEMLNSVDERTFKSLESRDSEEDDEALDSQDSQARRKNSQQQKTMMETTTKTTKKNPTTKADRARPKSSHPRSKVVIESDMPVTKPRPKTARTSTRSRQKPEPEPLQLPQGDNVIIIS